MAAVSLTSQTMPRLEDALVVAFVASSELQGAFRVKTFSLTLDN